MQDFYKIVPDYSFNQNEKLLFPITSEEILKRMQDKLINKYLYRAHIALCTIDSIQNHITRAIDEASELALDDSEPMWKEIDQRYKDEIMSSINL